MIRVRHLAALSLAFSLCALVWFSSVHIHGLSDPDRHHTFSDYYLSAQAQGGFLLPPTIAVVIAKLLIRLLGEVRFEGRPPSASAPYPARAPPRLTS
jgi:hypothetical protein